MAPYADPMGVIFQEAGTLTWEEGAVKGTVSLNVTLADFLALLCPQPGRAANILSKKLYQFPSGLRWGLLS